MLRSELHFLGHTIDLLTIETDYNKPFHKSKGFPYFYNEGGLLKVTFGFGENHRFLERMTTVDYDLYKKGYPLDDGKVMFYDANGDFLKRWSFQDAAIVFYKVVFDTNGGGMIVEMVISPAIQNYGEKLHRWWHISPIPEEEEYKSPVVSVEDNKEIIDFYYTDKKYNKDTILTFGDDAYLILETKNMVGKVVDLKLDIKVVDFIYNNERIKNDVIENYKIKSNKDKISVSVISKDYEEKN